MHDDINLASATVLIVDDAPDNREILEQALTQEGYNIVQAPSGEEALEIALRSSPALILLDVMMPPGINGFETCRRLKSDKAIQEIPVIFISARDDVEGMVEGFRSGGIDYITKPFEEQEVRARVKTQILIKLSRETIQNYNQILEAKVKKRIKELHETRAEIIYRLGRVSEFRDIPGLHVKRMSTYCGLLGRACGMNEAEMVLFREGSMVHDVGKVGIPLSILLKPGKLDLDELKIMKNHVTIGTEILSGSSSDLINMAKTIALTHHEKWDGTGYMHGLKGEDIPLEGRICAFCDAFDALTTDRPYRKGGTIEDAMAEIESLSGKHFDPHLVKLFKQMLPEIRTIKEQYAD